MDNSEIFNAISTQDAGQSSDAAAAHGMRQTVLFYVGDELYAFYSDEVREAVTAGDIYHVPFLPPYITGIINRHGEPYTVIDLKAVMDKGRLESSRVLIMNNGDDQVSFLISDIDKIVEVLEHEVIALPVTEGSTLFKGSFQNAGRDIFIINPQEIYDRLSADIKAI